MDKQNFSAEIEPHTSLLVSEDNIESDKIFVKPYPENTTINIKWKLFSKTYKQEGELGLDIICEIEQTNKLVLVSNPDKARVEHGDIEDFIVEEDV